MPTQPNNASWVIYPSDKQKFTGFYTEDDESRAPDLSCVYGMNTSPNNGDKISVRKYGYSLFQNTFSTTATPVTSKYTFHKRDGEQILMRAYSTYLEWFDEDANSGVGDWINLGSSYLSADFGFAEFNINTDQISRIYFGNALDEFSYWNGGHDRLNGALAGGEATIPVDSTLESTVFRSHTASSCTTTTLTVTGQSWGTNVWANYYVRITSGAESGKISLIASNTADTLTFASLASLSGTPTFQIRRIKFNATGTIRIGTTDVTYTGMTDSSFTGASGTPAAADNLTVSQAVQTLGIGPKGNIYMTSDNRLFISGDPAKPQIVYFSGYGDGSSWSSTLVNASTATAAGVFNLAEGGGAVTAMCQDEQAKYFFKDNIIYYATLSDSLYTLLPLKPFDGKSQTTGAKSKRSVFVGGNRVFLVSKDNQIYGLERVQYIDYPQLTPISESIQPTVDSLDFSDTAGIVFGEYALFACKSSAEQSFNDTVLVYNIRKGTWDSPWRNFNVSDFAIYKREGVEYLFFGDSVAANSWKINATGSADYEYTTMAIWRTKAYNFGAPQSLKELDCVFLEGKIAQNVTMTIKLLLDNDGFTQTLETAFLGTETQYLFETAGVNTFGENPLGIVVFGSNVDTTGKKPFRVFLNEDLRREPFFTAQLQFSSDGQNQNWEIIRYGFLVREHSQPIDTDLMRNW